MYGLLLAGLEGWVTGDPLALAAGELIEVGFPGDVLGGRAGEGTLVVLVVLAGVAGTVVGFREFICAILWCMKRFR